MTIEEVKAKLPYPEFVTWVEFFRREMNQRDKSEYYFAALRFSLHQLERSVRYFGVRPPPEKVTLETFLLTPRDPNNNAAKLAKVTSSGFTPADGKAYLAASKAAWGAALNLL